MKSIESDPIDSAVSLPAKYAIAIGLVISIETIIVATFVIWRFKIRLFEYIDLDFWSVILSLVLAILFPIFATVVFRSYAFSLAHVQRLSYALVSAFVVSLWVLLDVRILPLFFDSLTIAKLDTFFSLIVFIAGLKVFYRIVALEKLRNICRSLIFAFISEKILYFFIQPYRLDTDRVGWILLISIAGFFFLFYFFLNKHRSTSKGENHVA